MVVGFLQKVQKVNLTSMEYMLIIEINILTYGKD